MQTLKSLARQFSILNFALLVSAGLLLCSLAWADDGQTAESWLQRMVQANQQLSYQGRFIYQQGDRLDALEVVRHWQGAELQERVASLNGPQREVLRQHGQVLCLMPSDGSLMLESQLVHGLFPGFNPEQWGQAKQHYELRLGALERVAGYLSQVVEVLPKRQDRFAYRLWLEQQSGLLVRAVMLDEHGSGLSQMQFVTLDLDTAVNVAALVPSAAADQYFVIATSAEKHSADDKPVDLAAAQTVLPRVVLPPGFVLRSYQQLVAPGGANQRLQQLIYSDGLSQLSIYIEELVDGDVRFPASSRQGALNLRSRQLDHTLITAVGELPDDTLNEIVESIRLTGTTSEEAVREPTGAIDEQAPSAATTDDQR